MKRLQEFVIYDFNRMKLASMIYGVRRSGGKGLGYSQKSDHQWLGPIDKPNDLSSSVSAQKELYSYFVSVADKVEVMNRSEPKIIEQEIMREIKIGDLKVKGFKETITSYSKL